MLALCSHSHSHSHSSRAVCSSYLNPDCWVGCKPVLLVIDPNFQLTPSFSHLRYGLGQAPKLKWVLCCGLTGEWEGEVIYIVSAGRVSLVVDQFVGNKEGARWILDPSPSRWSRIAFDEQLKYLFLTQFEDGLCLSTFNFDVIKTETNQNKSLLLFQTSGTTHGIVSWSNKPMAAGVWILCYADNK